MKFHLLALDYDGTIAHDGVVSQDTLNSIQQLIKSGRKLVLVTGRELDDLLRCFKEPLIFDWIVAENGVVLYNPKTREHKILAEPPPARFVEELIRKGVGPISVGKAIVATWEPHQNIVLETIHELGLEQQVIFNKGAVMILPAGVNKATGLRAALSKMNISPHNTIGVGDAENDHAFLKECECGVALNNALPALKESATYLTKKSNGEGVRELIELLISGEKVLLEAAEAKRSFPIGKDMDDHDILFSPFQGNVLVAGSSGAGKSTFATTVLDGLIENELQFCLIDPEGDYAEVEKATVIGDSTSVPKPEEVVALLEKPSNNVIVNYVGVPLSDRPQVFLQLLSRLQDLRARVGRPHWIVIDEAHHVLPNDSAQAELILPKLHENTIFITLNPSDVLLSSMQPVATLVGVGELAPTVIQQWAKISALELPVNIPNIEGPGVVLYWKIARNKPPLKLKVKPNSFQRRRHKKKYAEGELPKDRSFHFKGPDGKLNLRARNLVNFIQLAEGVDEDTWQYHLKRHDYSSWIGAVQD